MDEAGKSAWCRAHGTYAQQLAAWQQSATQALAEPAALLVLSKKVGAIFNLGEAE